jgi:hypothetical protein
VAKIAIFRCFWVKNGIFKKLKKGHFFKIGIKFQVHRSVGQYWAEVARAFADSPVLPLNVSMYAQTLLEVYVSDLKKTLDSLENRFLQVKDGRAQVAHLIQNCQVNLLKRKIRIFLFK